MKATRREFLALSCQIGAGIALSGAVIYKIRYIIIDITDLFRYILHRDHIVAIM